MKELNQQVLLSADFGEHLPATEPLPTSADESKRTNSSW